MFTKRRLLKYTQIKLKKTSETCMKVDEMLKRSNRHDQSCSPVISVEIDDDETRDVINLEKDWKLKSEQEIIRDSIITMARILIMLTKGNEPFRIEEDVSILSFEDAERQHTMGNFNSLMLFSISLGNETLRQYLLKPNNKEIFTSQNQQNELIKISGRLIKEQVIKEIQWSDFYSVSADLTTDISGNDQIALSIRYVYDMKILEQFIGLIQVNEFIELSEAILSTLKASNLDIKKLRGQNYDGIVTNRLSRSVHSRIACVQPLAVYTHSHAHHLNSVVGDSCQVRDVFYAIYMVGQAIEYFRGPAQANSDFQSKVSNDPNYKPLKKFCETRWSERVDGLKAFTDSLLPMLEALEDLSLSRYQQISYQAFSLKCVIFDFKFIISLLVATQILDEIKTLSQAVEVGLNQVWCQFESVLMGLKGLQKDVEINFSKLYSEVLVIAEQLEIDADFPRIQVKDSKKAPLPSESVEEYFRRMVYTPFIDHVIVSLEERFNETTRKVFKINDLMASNIGQKLSSDLKTIVDEIKEIYKEDLVGSNLEKEVQVWKTRWSHVKEARLKPNTAIENLKMCNANLYPGLSVVFKIFCVLPVTSSEFDLWPFGREKMCFQNEVAEDVLNSYSLIHIHYKRRIDVNKVADIFMQESENLIKFI